MANKKPNGKNRQSSPVRSNRMFCGVDLIRLERERQIAQECWTPEHDDGHASGELALAAACYAAGRRQTHVRRMLNSARGMEDAGYIYDYSTAKPEQLSWPWEAKWYKPGKNRIRALVKAGALIAAEIDRLQRAKSEPQNDRTEPRRKENYE